MNFDGLDNEGKDLFKKLLSFEDIEIFDLLVNKKDPKDMTINLSPDVYEGRNISAAAVAAHECGHAVQHATAYKWLQLRSQMVPVVSLSSKMLNFIFLAGMFGMGVLHMFTIDMVILAVIFCQAIITIFSVIYTVITITFISTNVIAITIFTVIFTIITIISSVVLSNMITREATRQ